jgi:hypothetical protein
MNWPLDAGAIWRWDSDTSSSGLMLVKQSTYFQSIFSNFREAGYERITVEWDTPTILMLLQCMHGFNLSLSSSMVAPVLQVLINSLSIQGERTTPNLCRSDFFML